MKIYGEKKNSLQNSFPIEGEIHIVQQLQIIPDVISSEISMRIARYEKKIEWNMHENIQYLMLGFLSRFIFSTFSLDISTFEYMFFDIFLPLNM